MPEGRGIGYISGAFEKPGGHGGMSGNCAGAGPSGYCVCPSYGEKVVHKRGIPCNKIKCPKCRIRMTLTNYPYADVRWEGISCQWGL